MNGFQPPAFVANDPRGTFYWYVSQGMPYQEAANLVAQQFGPPKTREQLAREQQRAEDNAALAQVGGQIGGTALGIDALRGFSGTKKLLGIGKTAAGAKTGVAGAAKAGAAKAGAAGAAKAGAAGAAKAGAAKAGAAGAAKAGTSAGAAKAGALASAGPVAAIAAALIASGYTYNRIGKKTKTLTGGAAVKKAFKDPMAWLAPGPALIGALWGDKDMYLKEHRRLLDLQGRGINVPEQFLEATRLEKGRGKEDLIAAEKEKEAAGQYSNVKFAQTRDEADLNPEDIWGYSVFLDKFGNDWLGTFSEDMRRQIAQQALDAGAVNEHHGTIDIDWNKVNLPEDLTTLSATEAMEPVIPEKGKVARQSAGLYRDDQGNLVKANSMRAALERAYKGKNKKRKEL
jgi:hypothetical protein